MTYTDAKAPATGHITAPFDKTQTSFDVHLRGASVEFNGTSLFHDLALDLSASSFTCLLGPSGVGKSTLLRFLAGLVGDAASGTVTCGDGLPLTRRVAYMAQQDLLLPWRSVRENVVLGAVLRGEKPDLSRADHLIAEVGLGKAAHMRPAQLSGGMKQRAALARTLMEDRPVVLMDEPFSALDPLNRMRIQDLAARVLQGKTVLLVTHDPLEALRVGHKVVVLQGTPATVSDAVIPHGTIPRDITDPAILRHQARLLHQLGALSPQSSMTEAPR
ncbi:ABC transporter ATP-binding protein [uncultured Thalassospira sp.]|uniref:ABC transporter ATP-binding protein n=1 Tax=uncultured Thalassospira sp. TaxID=404382 RepID=UPI0030DC7867|tara:strand:- start:2304 stop:3125 length:822 start_codon:yes stop_codon:yes gene_type:complete